ncbi:MAG: protoheme IX farnesyltransferase [Proteobacteria bacterium]|nr:protoheme IX farnesyltransferase [Pseudomonadota bacterium]
MRNLWSLTKPRLSFLVVITAAGGWWMAPVHSEWSVGFLAVLGTTLTVASANVFNNYLERESDQRMIRTQDRPLAAQRLSPLYALVFGIVLCLIAIPLLTLLVHPMTGLLAGIALVSYVMIYTPLKRTSSFNTLVGAFPGAMPPLIGWVAATEVIDIGGILLFSILFLWQIPHSLAIAIYRGPEYKNAGLIILPNDKGLDITRRQMLLYTALLLPLPLLLSMMNITGILTAGVGSLLGLWWLYLAWIGLTKELEATWARRFFLSSLVYLTGLFGVITIDVMLARYFLG